MLKADSDATIDTKTTMTSHAKWEMIFILGGIHPPPTQNIKIQST